MCRFAYMTTLQPCARRRPAAADTERLHRSRTAARGVCAGAAAHAALGTLRPHGGPGEHQQPAVAARPRCFRCLRSSVTRLLGTWVSQQPADTDWRDRCNKQPPSGGHLYSITSGEAGPGQCAHWVDMQCLDIMSPRLRWKQGPFAGRRKRADGAACRDWGAAGPEIPEPHEEPAAQPAAGDRPADEDQPVGWRFSPMSVCPHTRIGKLRNQHRCHPYLLTRCIK